MIRILLLTEVADHVVAVRAALTQHVEVESVNFVPDVLVVEEEFRDVAKVLSVYFLLLRIELKHRQSIIPVNLVTWRTPHFTPLRVRFQLKLVFEEVETEGADVQNSAVILLWEVRMVPCFHCSFTKLDELDCLQASDLHEVS